MIWLLMAMVLTPAQAARKALVIGMTDYDTKSTGWSKLNGKNDAQMIEQALRAQGFAPDDILVLHDPRRDRVVQALDTWDVSPGDHLYIHFSGHGQPITDLDGDDQDGHDEALALIDTPATPKHAPRSYRGERHLTDDVLGTRLDKLRRRVGKGNAKGSVALVVDACFSGTIARGGATRGRGAFDLRGKPAASRALPARRSSGMDDAARSEAGAPLVVLSAAHAGQPASEISEGQLGVGALSTAIARVFSTSPTGGSDGVGVQTWQSLYQRVAAEMRRTVPGQLPQLEGDANLALFDGRFVQPPEYYTLEPFDHTSPSQVTLAAGTVLGLSVGDRISLRPSQAGDPKQAPTLATGRIVEVGPVQAIVDLDAPVTQAKVEDAWAIVDEWTGDVNVTVAVRLSDDVESEAWAKVLSDQKAVDARAESIPSADYVLTQRGDKVYLEKGLPAPSQPLYPLMELESGATPPVRLVHRVSDLARTNLVDQLDGLVDPRLPVNVSLVPAAGTGDDCARLDVASGGSFEHDQTVMLTVELPGAVPAFVSIVVTDMLGKSEQIYPRPDEGKVPRTGVVFRECVQVSWDASHKVGGETSETVRVFASESADGINFRNALLTAYRMRSRGIAETVFERLAELELKTRGRNKIQQARQDGVTSTSLTYRVAPPARSEP